MILDSYLIEAIQTLSRQTKVKSVTLSLLKIIHQNLNLAKTILVIEKEYTAEKTDFLIAIAKSQTDETKKEPVITFVSESAVESHQADAPLSLLNYFRQQQEFSFISNQTKTDLQDAYFTQQQPANFYCFPVVDKEQFFGILYLENLDLTPPHDSKNSDSNSDLQSKFIAAMTALVTQIAIAFSNFLTSNSTINQQNQTLKQEIINLKQKSLAMEIAIDGIGILKEEKFVYLNSSHIKMFGYDDPAELLGQNWRVLYPPEEISKIEQQAFPVFIKQGYWRGQCKARKRNGTLLDEEIALYKLNEQEMVCICRDISDRKVKEEQLKEIQKRYLNLSATVPVGIFSTDKFGNFSYVNNRWCLITGLNSEQAMGQGWFKNIHPEDLMTVLQQWDEAIDNESSFCGEFRFITSTNIEVWVFKQAIAEYDNNGQLVGYVGTITDISQLKESQKYLTRQLQREQLLKQITQEIRRNWDISAISYTAATQIGKVFQVSRCLIHDYVIVSEAQIPIVAQYLADDKISAVNLTILVADNHYVLKVLSQDFAVVSSDITTEPLLSQMQDMCQKLEIKSILAVRTSYQGKSNGIIALHQCDRIRRWTIEEVELLEAVAVQMGIAIAQARLLEKEQQQRQELYLNNLALTKAKKDAEVANKAKSQFLAHMSHELRTPLNAILGFSQIMVRDDYLSNSQREQIEIINRSGQHLLNLINNILDLSKIEAGKTTVQQDYLDFYDFIQGIEQMFQLQTQAKGLNLLVQINPEVPQFIIVDAVRLKQILINLLSNAIKFTTKGEIGLQIKSQNYQSLIFKITDTGAGIAKKDLDRMFEPFEQTNTGIKSGRGTGLGLSICRSLIKLLGGMLEVESVVNKGTTFLFQIPIETTKAKTINSSDVNPTILKIADEQPKQKILVVDDNRENCTLLTNLLTQVGFMVKEAYNGQEAVEIYQSWLPDLILMDIQMPIMDGYQATKQIKHQDTLNRTKIIAATASVLQTDKAKIIENGFVDIISKPYEINNLLSAIAKHLDITYIYSDDYSTKESVSNSSDTTLKQLKLMPKEWLQKLHYAAISASDRKIHDLIVQIPDIYTDLAEELKNMVDNFALEAIINQVENLLEIHNETNV